VVFNSGAVEKTDDIGIINSIGVFPPDVLGAIFGVSPHVFSGTGTNSDPNRITRNAASAVVLVQKCGGHSSSSCSCTYTAPPAAQNNPWNNTGSENLFRLSLLTPPAVNKPNIGDVRGANQDNFPILEGNAAAYFVHLLPCVVREPHWHLFAWEVDYVISGTAKYTILAPLQQSTTFTAIAGDVVFIPQGYIHYFENAGDGTQDLEVFVVFNSGAVEKTDDIGLVNSIGVFPPDVLGALFGVSPTVFSGTGTSNPNTITLNAASPVVLAKKAAC